MHTGAGTGTSSLLVLLSYLTWTGLVTVLKAVVVVVVVVGDIEVVVVVLVTVTVVSVGQFTGGMVLVTSRVLVTILHSFFVASAGDDKIHIKTTKIAAMEKKFLFDNMMKRKVVTERREKY